MCFQCWQYTPFETVALLEQSLWWNILNTTEICTESEIGEGPQALPQGRPYCSLPDVAIHSRFTSNAYVSKVQVPRTYQPFVVMYAAAPV